MKGKFTAMGDGKEEAENTAMTKGAFTAFIAFVLIQVAYRVFAG